LKPAVILLGAPRSGTTVLFEALGRSSHLWSLAKESHEVLEGPFHPAKRGWTGNQLDADDLDDETAAALREEFHRKTHPGQLRRYREARRRGDTGAWERLHYNIGRFSVLKRRRAGEVTVLEKTPKNCLRLPFLDRLMPDARYVHLQRDGRATVSSLMDGWRKPEMYETYAVPERLRIPGYDGTKWCFILPPEWRDLLDKPLEEVCARQWVACVNALEQHLPGPRGEGRVHDVKYEDLVEDPQAAIRGILEFLGLPWEDALLPESGQLDVVNAVTPPEPDKWRRRNGEAVDRILPIIAEAQGRLGYPLDRSDGSMGDPA
jgi:hypothetical protein